LNTLRGSFSKQDGEDDVCLRAERLVHDEIGAGSLHHSNEISNAVLKIAAEPCDRYLRRSAEAKAKPQSKLKTKDL